MIMNKWDLWNLITLTVITLSGFHCNYHLHCGACLFCIALPDYARLAQFKLLPKQVLCGLDLDWSRSWLVSILIGLDLDWSRSWLVSILIGLDLVWSRSWLVSILFGLNLDWSRYCLILILIGLNLYWSRSCLVSILFGLDLDWSQPGLSLTLWVAINDFVKVSNKLNLLKNKTKSGNPKVFIYFIYKNDYSFTHSHKPYLFN